MLPRVAALALQSLDEVLRGVLAELLVVGEHRHHIAGHRRIGRAVDGEHRHSGRLGLLDRRHHP